MQQSLMGQVAVVHSRAGLMGRLVQLVIGSFWNHNIVAINDLECVSAEPGGAIIRPISYYAADHTVVWSRFELTHTQRWRIATWARKHKGVEYGYGDFIAAGIAAITKHATPRWLRKITANPKRLICSQLCDLALQAGDIHLFTDDRPLGAVTPGSFGRVFKRLGWTDRD